VRELFRLRYAKTAALAAAAGFYVPLVADWCEPGFGLDQAAAIIAGTGGLTHPVIWHGLVRLVGRDIPLLGTVSMAAAFACAVLMAFVAGDLVAIALRAMRRRVMMSDEAAGWIRHRAAFLAALAFVLTPGFFHAATHIGPLHVLLIPFLAGLALLTRLLSTVEESLYLRLKQGFVQILLAMTLLACALFEMFLSRRFLLTERLSFAVFVMIGIFPLAILAHLTRRRLLLSRKSYVRFFAAWAVLVAASGITSLALSGRGRVASRIVRHILDNATDCQAVVSDGPLDQMFFFMLPKDWRLILLSRDGDIAYGRELADWVRERCDDSPELAYAAELGPRALVDEWRDRKRGVSQGLVLTPDAYFPTVGKWREGCAELAGLGWREPFGAQLRSLLGAAGNRHAVRFLEAGDATSAWKTFWDVAYSVDAGNGLALENLSKMLAEGYEASREEREWILQQCEADEESKTPAFRWMASEGGNKPKGKKTGELSPHAQALIQMASAEQRTRADVMRVREAIRRGIEGGSVNLEQVGARLLAIDCRLEDWRSAEKDAVSILRRDRRHAKANAVMGKLAVFRRDYRAAEHYLQLALAGGVDEQDAVAKDLEFARAHREPSEGTASRPTAPPRLKDGNAHMPFGGFAGRLFLSVVFVVLAYVTESTAVRTRIRRIRHEHMQVSEWKARMDEAYKAAERERPVVHEGAACTEQNALPAYRPYNQMTAEEREARKDWARARLMKHSRNPDWKRDESYLELVLEAAIGGCGEAMNKLCEYALGRRAYVEAYYWALKVELAGVRKTGVQPDAILQHWLKHRTSKKHHRFHSGFYDDEYHFARAVMRVRGGVEKKKGLMRLRQLAEDEFEDAVLFLQKNGLEKETDDVS